MKEEYSDRISIHVILNKSSKVLLKDWKQLRFNETKSEDL